jgi:Protein of unknown function (DUF1565)
MTWRSATTWTCVPTRWQVTCLACLAVGLLLVALILVCPIGNVRAGGANFCVSPAGSNSNPGTLTQPWKTIGKAMATLTPGQAAFVRAGTYQEARSGSCGSNYNRLIWSRSGQADAPINILGYPGEGRQVVVQTAIKLAGSYLRLKNMIVAKNSGYSSSDYACTGRPNIDVYGSNNLLNGLEIKNWR